MYFDVQKCNAIVQSWLTVLKEPWASGLILGLQGNCKEKPAPIFTMLRDVWSWEIDSLFDLIAKPPILLVVLAVSLVAFGLKLALMLTLLPLWLFIAVTASIKSGLPDYPQIWLSPYD